MLPKVFLINDPLCTYIHSLRQILKCVIHNLNINGKCSIMLQSDTNLYFHQLGMKILRYSKLYQFLWLSTLNFHQFDGLYWISLNNNRKSIFSCIEIFLFHYSPIFNLYILCNRAVCPSRLFQRKFLLHDSSFLCKM